MRNRLFILFWVLLPLTVMAQSYVVYSVVGTAKMQNGKTMVPLRPRKMVTTQTKIQIAEESSVTIIDEQNSKLYMFTSPGVNTVGQLINQSKTHTKYLSKHYVSYIVKQMFGDGSQKMTHPDTYMQTTATAYRSVASDSLLINKMAELLSGNPLQSMESRLIDPKTPLLTDYDVQFDLIDCSTGQPVMDNVSAGTSCYVRISNRTNEVLYMNVLDIDDQGNKYLVLPLDEALTCAHLLVPPLGTVSFKADPFIFGDDPSKETFILMATPDPVDFSIVMNPICSNGNSNMQTGLLRKFYQVK